MLTMFEWQGVPERSDQGASLPPLQGRKGGGYPLCQVLPQLGKQHVFEQSVPGFVLRLPA